MIRLTIPLCPITKKNHQQIIWVNGRPKVLPSKQYLQYEKDARWFLIGRKAPTGIVNIQATYYMKTKRKVDITNLHNALHDVLVAYGVITDDSSKYVGGTDGSRVLVDKDNPRTEVLITIMQSDNELF